MIESHEPQPFDVATPAVPVLQELQIILGVEDHFTEARALEAALVWYDNTTAAGHALRFSPPPGQRTWHGYTRLLEIDPLLLVPEAGEVTELMVGGDAQRRLARSEGLKRLATPLGLERIVRLKAEYQLRLKDDWTIEVETERLATS